MSSVNDVYVKPITLFDIQKETGNQDIDGLLWGFKWKGPITFSFPESGDVYSPNYYLHKNTNNFYTTTPFEREAVRAILIGTPAGEQSSVSIYNPVVAFTDLPIVETSDGRGAIRVAHTDAHSPLNIQKQAETYPPVNYLYENKIPTSQGGDVWLNSTHDQPGYETPPGVMPVPKLGNQTYEGIAHELGHALGLKHANDETTGVTHEHVSDNVNDIEYSIMNYHGYFGSSISYITVERNGFPQTYMMLDIAALQTMYGANFSYHADDTTYRWDAATGEMSVREGMSGSFVGQGTPVANRVFLTTWDGGGNDTYDMSNYTGGVSIDLRPGQSSITSHDQLANLGTKTNDKHEKETVYAQGNVYNSLLYQGDTRSLIENATGGSGQDHLVGNTASNRLEAGAGNDTLNGDLGDDLLLGQDGNDTVLGGEGNDFGSGGFDNDTVLGEAGNDLLFGNDNDDLVDGGDGNDLVYGGTGNDTVFGSAGTDQVYGEDGNDFVGTGSGNDFGSGGFGNDEVHGEEGDDLLFGDDGNDGVYGEDGDDRVYGGTGNDHLTGDAGTDYVRGEDGDDRLFGGEGGDDLSGGAGNDTIEGGAGFDLLFGNAGDDVLSGGAGPDIFGLGRGDGRDVIRDFVTGGAEADVIAFNGGAFADFAAVQAATRQEGADVVIAYGAGDGVTLLNVQASALSAANFTFA